MWRCCLNPKVIGGLVVVGLLVWLVAPGPGGAAWPLLIGLICPLSMGAMVWRMRRADSCEIPSAQESSAGIDEELRALREELAMVRAQRHLASRDNNPRC